MSAGIVQEGPPGTGAVPVGVVVAQCESQARQLHGHRFHQGRVMCFSSHLISRLLTALFCLELLVGSSDSEH